MSNIVFECLVYSCDFADEDSSLAFLKELIFEDWRVVVNSVLDVTVGFALDRFGDC